VYRFVVRSKQQPFMAALDCADPSLAVDRRNQTMTPQQALALLNNKLSVAMARHFAARVEKLAPDDVGRVNAAFRLALGETGISSPVAHTSYLINLASPDDHLWQRSIDAMVDEVERCGELGILDLVLHPGAHMGEGEDAGISRVVFALDQVHRRTKRSKVIIDLETTAGQGTSLGYRFEHLQAILEGARHSERLGVCVDTCHVFAAGYRLDTAKEYDGTMDRLDRAVGLNRLRVWHVNDSCRECGSRVDRHAAIGQGRMGLEPFRHLVNDPRFRGLPMILETPKGTEDGEDLDVRNARTLRLLAGPARASRISRRS
jgi:deoxyribonuclease-4